MPARSRRLAAGLVLAFAATACRRSHAGSGSPDAAATDGGRAEARDASAAMALDAAPPDDAIPAPSSDELTTRARHLLEAIANDNPDLAADILFPRDGWLATRDAADPGKDWERRVASPFRRAVHAWWRRYGDELQRAQFASLELGRALVQATPRRHGWKKPLWTVHDSRLTFVVDGHTRTLSIREMTAWRGAWYVTRLR